jgi:hypothetical protein
MPDLWPEAFLDEDHPKAPVAVLKEQASFLGEKTRNLVVAEVKPLLRREFTMERLPSTPDTEPHEEFRYAFYIVAPALQNYTYRLFTIANGIGLYPVNVYWTKADTEVEIAYNHQVADNQAEFEGILERIFNSQRTLQLIAAILTQSEVADDFYDIPS